ncbi:MAG: LacI family DNA-binding transcriptional regulator [Lewinellaceae bacterium]|nr:LacI family DNA-binding transcriptional regulator [Lewinellaceae bacterium]
MQQRIRIKDIAAQTGVSIGTVDRVLHNRGHVAPEVRIRVLRVMEEMGYQPNMVARSLANNKKHSELQLFYLISVSTPIGNNPRKV